MGARLFLILAVTLVTQLAAACASTSGNVFPIGGIPFRTVYERLDYVGIVAVVGAKPDPSGAIELTVTQVEAMKGDRSTGSFTVAAPRSDLVPETKLLLVLQGTIGPALQWVFPVVIQGKDEFVFAARDNAFFPQTWLSSNENTPFFIVEQGRIVAAMKLSAVRQTLDCAKSAKTPNCPL